MRMLPNIRSIAAEPRSPVRLNSWKEIAAYLNRDPRTVQMWERNEGLPVHRIAHQARSTVYAYPAEIDAWLKTRSGKAAKAAPETEQTEPASPARRRIFVRLLPEFVTLLAACLLVGLWRWHVTHRPTAGSTTVAVLPFESQTSEDDPLVEGLTEDVISDLGQSGQFKVISRRNTSAYRNRRLPLQQIASELHTSLVLRGVVAQVNGQVAVTVELVDAVHGTHLWGRTYNSRTADMLASEDEIAATIANAVSEHITGSPTRPRSEPRSADARAMEAYLEGRFYWNQRGLSGLQKGIASFQQAIAIDPKFAGAYAGLADCYDLMTDRGVMSNDEAFRLAKDNARIALELDPNSAEAYNALAFATYRQDWDFQRAESYFKKAIQLNPNYSVAHQWYGEFLGDLRRFDESIAELHIATELRPLSPMVSSDLAEAYMHAGRLPDAEAELKRVVELYPKFEPAHLYLITVYIGKSNLEEAEAEAQTYKNLSSDDSVLIGLSVRRLIAAGKMDEARALVRLAVAKKTGAVDPYQAASLYFLAGQKDAGYAALEDAYRQHSWWLVTMLVDPGFQNVRSEPRFLNLARRVGLPGTQALVEAKAQFPR